MWITIFIAFIFSTIFSHFRTAPDIPQDQRDLVPMIQEVIDAQNLSVKDATVKFGKACGKLHNE